MERLKQFAFSVAVAVLVSGTYYGLRFLFSKLHKKRAAETVQSAENSAE